VPAGDPGCQTRREAVQLEQSIFWALVVRFRLGQFDFCRHLILFQLAEIAMPVQPLAAASLFQASPNAFRARAKRDMTVPIGRAVISEIW
jgi:hypothetical protein